jgi:Zn-dependent M28 family amino/carboxypeptidase
VTAPAVLLVGVPTDTAQPFGAVDVRGAIIVQTIPVGALMGRRSLLPLITKAVAAGARGMLILANAPPQLIASQARNVFAPQYALDLPQAGGPAPIPLLIARDTSAVEVLRAAGEDLAALRDTSAHGIRAMNGVTVTIAARRRVVGETTAPNVLGVLEGSDPQLKGEYVFFTGHMDHIGVVGGGQGCAAIGADSICNGADDDASGTTGVVELAEAFSRLTPRPRRTLVFMTVSGEERGLWGSTWYSEHPEFPLAQTAADLNMDMIGRYYNDQPGWADTIVVIGKEHSSLGAVANQVTRDHPELAMRLIDDIWPEQNFYRRSDHFNFARKGVPILFFFNGTHPDYHRAGDSVDKIDAEKEARIIRMVFYVGLEVANATARPQWNPESRRQIVEAGN